MADYMAMDPSQLSPNTFGVPVIKDGALEITGVAKKAVSGETAAPKEMTDLVQDIVKRVKETGSRTDATIQLTQECANRLKISHNPAAIKTLQKFVSDVKKQLIARESAKMFGTFRVGLSRLVGGIGKLEKLEKELQLASVAQPVQKAEALKPIPQATPKAKTAEENKLFGQKVSGVRERLQKELFPEGVLTPGGVGPVESHVELPKRQEDTTRTFENGARFSEDLCPTFSDERAVVGLMSLYVPAMYPQAETPNPEGLLQLRKAVGSSVFQLLPSRENPGKEVVVVVGKIGKKGVIKPEYHTVTIPQKSTPKNFLEQLQKKHGVPFTQALQSLITTTANSAPAAQAKAESAVDLVDREMDALKNMGEELKKLHHDMELLSSSTKDEAPQEIRRLSSEIQRLQRSIVADIDDGSIKPGMAAYKPQMEKAFAALVDLQEKLDAIAKTIESRPARREQEVRDQSKLFGTALYGLCVQKNEDEVRAGMRTCIERLPTTGQGRRLIEENGGKFFKLRMDFDHPDRIYIIGAHVSLRSEGKPPAIGFENREVRLEGGKYRWNEELLSKEQLLERLKENYGVPIDLKLEVESGYFAIGENRAAGA